MASSATDSRGPAYVRERQAWLDRLVEPTINSDLPIIDPHHHLWHTPQGRYQVPELLIDLAAGHRIVATVFVECETHYRQDGPGAAKPLGETAYACHVGEQAGAAPAICAGIVGSVDLRLGGALPSLLDEHVALGGGRFRGVRHRAAWDPAPELQPPGSDRSLLLDEPEFASGLATLGRKGLSFDAWIYHPQLPKLTKLAQAVPGTRIIIDHAGGPLGVGPYSGRREDVFKEWRAGIRALAQCDNVCIKIGGLGMGLCGFRFHEGADPPSSEDLVRVWRPYVETCIEAFGPARCMFESNFPVDRGSYSYGTVWNAFKRMTAKYMPGEVDRLFRGTAAEIYSVATP